MNIKKIAVSFVAAVAMLTISAFPAFASYSLFGDSSLVSGGNPGNAAQIRSDATIAPFYGGVSFSVPAGTTLSSLAHLKTDYKIVAGDCGGGAPRFQINIGGKNIQVYIGPTPSFTGCPFNTWTTTEDFIGSTDKVFDLTQYGGPFYGTYADAVALLGTQTVTGVQLVTDGEWAVTGGVQTVLVDNVFINNDIYTFDPNVPTDMNQCKDGGWQNYQDSNFKPFKNQGDCVSYIQSSPNAVGNKTK